MFMFRRKRTTWIKRLLKAGKRRRDDTDGGLSRRVEDFLKTLEYNQLEMLDAAVASDGLELSQDCVLLRKQHQHQLDSRHVLCCQMWRWPDLGDGDELRRMPTCKSRADPIYTCCNPYHWSRLAEIGRDGSPPPPYSSGSDYGDDWLLPEDRAPSEAPLLLRNSAESLTTSGEDSLCNSQTWCKLAYWEKSERIGPLFPVDFSHVNIFGNVPLGDGLCLETLAKKNCNNNISPAAADSVNRTRMRIGLGITLASESGSVWLYNHSEQPVFVHSAQLEDTSGTSAPLRLSPKHCVQVHDWSRREPTTNGGLRRCPLGPIDTNSVRVSFGKGWGPGYSRQEIKSCNCWLEVLLAPCR